MSYLVYNEIVKIDVNPAANLAAPYSHRKFAVICNYNTNTEAVRVVKSKAELDALDLTATSKEYIGKWFTFGGKEISIIDKALITNEVLVALPAFNVIADDGEMNFSDQVALISASDALDLKYKYYYFSCTDAELTSQQAIDTKRNCAVFIDNLKSGRWFDYLVGYETIDNYPREDSLSTSISSDTRLDVDGSNGYIVGNLQSYLIDNKVAGIFSDSNTSTNKMFNVYSKENLPVRLNFLMEDIINSARLANASFLQDFQVPFNDFGAKSLVARTISALKKYGVEQLRQVVGYPISTIIPVKNMPVIGTFSGQTITYKAKLYGRFNEIVANERI